ncbi:MAG: 50S ribosomal protein L11 methyltransferase [Pseudomonadota bacterium]|nr:50S ribosomal protein L11 methyltransferase [Pseudomonadota bacterium]
MSYRALRFETDASGAAAWSDALLEAGALSVDLSDPNVDGIDEAPIYGEPGMPVSLAWPLTRVTALFDGHATLDAAVIAACARCGAALPAHEIVEVPDQDWIEATRAQFAPLRISAGLWVVPTWATAPDPAAVNLVLDPGLAFGTGSHPTTRLCLQWLADAKLKGSSVLDYGCGSGILAIAAARLGAGEVVGTDIDPQAITAARANAERNGVRVTFLIPDELPSQCFDIVVSNILANPLVLLAPALSVRVRESGWLVLSGVLEDQAGEVGEAYGPWFKMAVWQRDDGWVALAGERLTSAQP